MRRVLMSVVMVGMLSVPAWAHADLDKATPKVGEKVASAPAAVTLAFTEELKGEKSGVEVFDASGKQVDKGDAHLDATDKSKLSVSLATGLGAGKYTVKWHVECVFGHKTEGSFGFTVARE